MGAKVFIPSLKSGARVIMTFLMPKLNKIIGTKITDNDIENFTVTIIKKTIKFRAKTNLQRNDFIQVNSGFNVNRK